MKKRLLFALVALCVSVSGFALEQGDFVYTPQGRFQITGANLNANNAFQDLTGWTVISASAEKTLADNFNINANGLVEGFNSVQSIDATEGEGMYFKFEPTDANATYVVSYKLKGATALSVRVKTVAVSTNLVKVYSSVEETDDEGNVKSVETVVNTAEELSEDWQTFNYAIVGDGAPRIWNISFSGLATNIEIADLQIAPAVQIADLRQRDAMLEKLNVYKNCYEWPAAVLEDCGFDEIIENLQAIGNESGQAALDEQLATAQDILDEFIKANMDDYLPSVEVTATTNGAGSPKVDVKFSTWYAKTQKAITWGDWTCLPAGRGFWESAGQGCADFGHFQNSNTWNNGDPTSPMGLYMQKTLDPGSYVFSIEARACLREPKKNDWNDEDGLKPAYGVAYIVKVVDGVTTDTVASTVKGLEPAVFGTFLVPAKIEENGTYEIGFKSYCKESHQGLKQGSVTYIKNAAIWGKNDNQYSQKELGYEADVREQITTGRNQLNTAAENIANPDFLWGKDELQACVDTVETKIAAYELLTQDDIIATYEEDYAKSTSAETGYMVYEVYQTAVKDIIAANKKFKAVNDTLNSIQVAIDNAEATMASRLYGAATGKDDLTAAINAAKDVQAQMKASQYSEENAAAIKAANATLAEAVEAFKATVPASAIVVLADIDFATPAVKDEETGKWSIAGAVNSMVMDNYATAEESAGVEYSQGYFVNGEAKYADMLHVGSGDAIVYIPEDKQVGDANILKLDFDYHFGKLNGKYAGFSLQGDEDATIAKFFFSPYDGKAEPNTFGIDFSTTYIPSYGQQNVDNADMIAGPDYAVHFEVIVDYGDKTMYCVTTNANGVTQTTQKVAFDGTKMSSFVVTSNYTDSGRRCWFNDLKIVQISAEATPVIDGIREVNPSNVVAPSKVLKNGRLVINGKYGADGILIK